jgi:phosphoribosylformylglycinamidine synthase
MAASPNLCSRAWVTDQYDRYVRGNTASAQPADAGIVRVDEETGRGIAVATDCNARFVALDPYAGTQLALAEAYRNVATSGAVPQAVTNCLNFGSPEDPHVMWQFAEAVRGLADGCAELGIPVTGGNVSFYNQTGSTAILPTPVVGVLGLLDDVARRVRSGFVRDGDAVLLLGTTRDELAGSEWAHVVHGHLGGRPPQVDLAAEQRLAALLAAVAADGLLTGSHDLSDGGLAQALVEACLVGGRGATVVLPRLLDPFVALFAESTGRVLVTVDPADADAVGARAKAAGVPVERLGATGGETLEIADVGTLDLTQLRAAWEGTLPALFDTPAAVVAATEAAR